MSTDDIPRSSPGGDAAPGRAEDLVEIVIRHLPVSLYERARAHHEALLREFEFIAHSEDRSRLPGEVVALISAIRRHYTSTQTDAAARISRAAADGDTHVDLVLQVPVTAGPVAMEVSTLLDEADELCRRGALLTVETPDELVALRRWYLGEIRRQVAGEQPTPWPGAQAVSCRRS